MAKSQSLRERMMEKKANIKSSQSGGDFYTIKEGTTRVRHLPVGKEQEFYVELVYVFLSKELGGFICPSTWGEKSAFKEVHDKFAASKSEDDRAFAKNKLRLGKKYGSPVAKYADEDGKEFDEKGGAKLLLMTGGLLNETIDLYLDTKEAGDFTDEDEGYDLKYTRTGKTQTDTEYFVRACKPTKLKKPFRGKTWNPIEMAKEITPSYKKTKELMEQFLSMKPEDLDGDSKDRKKKKSSDSESDIVRKKKKKKRSL